MRKVEELENAKQRLLNSDEPITLTLPYRSWNTFKRTIKKVPKLILRPGTSVHLTDGQFFMETYIYTDDFKWKMLDEFASY